MIRQFQASKSNMNSMIGKYQNSAQKLSFSIFTNFLLISTFVTKIKNSSKTKTNSYFLDIVGSAMIECSVSSIRSYNVESFVRASRTHDVQSAASCYLTTCQANLWNTINKIIS